LKLITHIRAIHEESKHTYGSPRMHTELRSRGVRCSRNRVAKVMREEGIRAKHKRKFKATTDSNHKLAVHENKLNRSFEVKAPNRVWACDITYIYTREGWLYLAVILDLFSRKVIGWSMQERIDKKLVIAAITMALRARRLDGDLVHHSDRGSQYASLDYQQILKEAAITCSMSRKGNCWDNAVAESFFSSLKREWVQEKNYETRAEARADIFHYIEIWYNRKRRHSTLGYLSPAEFERKAAESEIKKAVGA
jgi:putative transposase